MSRRPSYLALIITFLFAGGLWGQTVDTATIEAGRVGPGPFHKVFLDDGDEARLSQLRSLGAIKSLHEYGSFRVAVVDEAMAGGRQALLTLGVDIRDEHDLVVLNGIRIDGTKPTEALDRLVGLERHGSTGAVILPALSGLYLVQFAGPIQDAWRDLLDAVGAEVVQYVPMNAYIVRAEGKALAELEGLKVLPEVQMVVPYEPGFRMKPVLRELARGGKVMPVWVTVQVLRSASAPELEEVRNLFTEIEVETPVGPYVNIRGVLSSTQLTAVSRHRRVFALEPAFQRVRLDERQGQIVAGNTSGGQASGTGYLTWLASQGFGAGQFSSFAVNVVDDAPSLTGHPDLASSRVAFALNPTGQSASQAGHGFLNAHIIAGFNSQTGSAYEDSLGYNYGLGIAPWARVGATAIFGSGGSSPSSWENSAYANGSRISSNSWGYQTFQGGPVADYDSNSQEYDFLARDARNAISGNQEYVVVFSAGNNGSGSNTVTTPATAKNVITVGAGENWRPTGSDGCGIGTSGADDFNDIISFSSRGPVNSGGGDGRWKPEIVAPGTHVQAGVPQSNFVGGGVCNNFFPSGQTLYGWSSGTSHSAPAVAGGAALLRQWFLNNSMGTPSPALTKAMLLASAEYLTGAWANDTLPSNDQGMGGMNLGRAFDSVSRIIVDQDQLLQSTGASYTVNGFVNDATKPLRICLAWTDAPGPTSGAPFVNNLNLEVSIGGSTYRGNVFSGAFSTTGGTADFRNNAESVFLPAGVTGAFTVTVTAASIGGDGVPQNGDSTDQDFALIIHNGSENLTPPTAAFSGSPLSGDSPLAVSFTDSSTGAINTWAWTFGDGAVSSASNPTHVYTTPGVYDVGLTVSGPGGSNTLTMFNYVTVNAPVPPAAPSGLGASSASAASIDLTWTDNAANEDDFEIQRSSDGVSFSALATVAANSSSYSDTAVSANETWYYRVRAVNAAGTSAWSNIAMATTPAAAPVVANGELTIAGTTNGSFVDTQADDGSPEVLTERRSGGKPANRYSFLEHEWTFAVGAGPATLILDAWRSANSEGDDFVFAWSGDGVNFTTVTQVSNSAPGLAQSYPLGSIPGGTLTVRVTDTDQTAGNASLDTVSVDYIAIQAASGGGSAPSSPSGLTATATSSSSIDLAWSDNSSDEDGFLIERSSDGINFSQVGQVGAGVTSFANSGLAAATTYDYRVIAFNVWGNSAASNTASATTQPGSGGGATFFATSETTPDGSRSGSLADTLVSDGIRESIRESSSGGPPSQRVTSLEHRWTIPVTGTPSSLEIRASRSSGADDVFYVRVSNTGAAGTWNTVHTISNVADGGIVSVPLSGLSGTVYVQVIDSDPSPGNSSRDTVFIDYLAVMTP